MFSEPYVFIWNLLASMPPVVETFGFSVGIAILSRSGGFINLASGPLGFAGAAAIASIHLLVGPAFAGSVFLFLLLFAAAAIFSIMITPIPRSGADPIVVEGNRRVMTARIRSYFKSVPSGLRDEAVLTRDLKSLVGTGLFRQVQMNWAGGRLIVSVIENPVIHTALTRSLFSLAGALIITALANHFGGLQAPQRLTVPIRPDAPYGGWDPFTFARSWASLASLFLSLLSAQICLVTWKDEIASSRKWPATIVGLACTMFAGALPIVSGSTYLLGVSIASSNSIAALAIVVCLGSRSLANLGAGALAWGILTYVDQRLGALPYVPAVLAGVLLAGWASLSFGAVREWAPATATRWKWADTLLVVALAAGMPQLGPAAYGPTINLAIAVLGLSFFRLYRDRLCACGPLFCALGGGVAYSQGLFPGLSIAFALPAIGAVAGAAFYMFFRGLSATKFLAVTLILSYVGGSALFEVIGVDGVLVAYPYDRSQLESIGLICLGTLALLFWGLQALTEGSVGPSAYLELACWILGSLSLVLSGTLIAWQQEFVTFEEYSIERAVLLLGLGLAAGRGSVAGTMLAALLWTLLPQFAVSTGYNDLLASRNILVAAVLVAGVQFFPRGIFFLGQQGKQATTSNLSGVKNVPA